MERKKSVVAVLTAATESIIIGKKKKSVIKRQLSVFVIKIVLCFFLAPCFFHTHTYTPNSEFPNPMKEICKVSAASVRLNHSGNACSRNVWHFLIYLAIEIAKVQCVVFFCLSLSPAVCGCHF